VEVVKPVLQVEAAAQVDYVVLMDLVDPLTIHPLHHQ
jgi:hypothetical protein